MPFAFARALPSPEVADQSGLYYDDCKVKAPNAVATPGPFVGTPTPKPFLVQVDVARPPGHPIDAACPPNTAVAIYVTDMAGNTGPASAVMGLLIGDVNGDVPNAPGLVDSGDVFLVRQNTGQGTTLTNFRKDINANGLVDSGDVFLTRQHTGSQLPTPP